MPPWPAILCSPVVGNGRADGFPNELEVQRAGRVWQRGAPLTRAGGDVR